MHTGRSLDAVAHLRALSGRDREAFLEQLEREDATLHQEVLTLLRLEDGETHRLDDTERESQVPTAQWTPGDKETDSGKASPKVDRLAAKEDRRSSWDRYEILDRVGRGGMGEVYRAWDPRLKRTVAIKFIRHDSVHHEERFRREAAAHARVEHENVLKIYETGNRGDELFIAMQFVDGPTLLGVRNETTIEEKIRILCQACEGMHAAHRLGIVHRDIKPANILIERSPDGEWKPRVTDFGLAAQGGVSDLTKTGEVLGTPSYMAPEQVRGDTARIDRRTDVYALGATMFEFLSGHRPFEADSTASLLSRILHEDPTRLRTLESSVPSEIELVVHKCLEKEPERRYASARALGEDLQRFLDGEPVEARPASLIYRLRKKARKHRGAVRAMAVGLVIVAGFGVASLRQVISVRKQAEVVQRLGHRVMELEYLGRVAHVAPLHDIRPENQLIRDRLAEMEEEVATEGRFAEGPVAAALGRVHLALFDYESARTELERAWNVGYREGAVAYALGRTLGALYESQAALADQIENSTLRLQQKAEIRILLLDPAVDYLRLGQEAALDSEGFVEAVIGRYEERYDDALAEARSLYERASWQYEARKLEGDIHVARGDKLRDVGSFEEAERAYEKAEIAYLEGSHGAGHGFMGTTRGSDAEFPNPTIPCPAPGPRAAYTKAASLAPTAAVRDYLEGRARLILEMGIDAGSREDRRWGGAWRRNSPFLCSPFRAGFFWGRVPGVALR